MSQKTKPVTPPTNPAAMNVSRCFIGINLKITTARITIPNE